MTELLLEYTKLVGGTDESAYVAQAWGRQRDHRWEGWLVFVPINRSQARRTEPETTQSTREHLVYWATGLEPVYLDGALKRSIPLRLGSSAA